MLAKVHRSSKFYRLTGVGVALLLIISGILALEISNTTHFFHKQQATSGFQSQPTLGGASSSNTKGENKPASSSPRPSSNSSDKGEQASPSTALTTPFGDFVSNHAPGQHGSPLTETSVCNTTSGASCTIVFTMGSASRSLPEQTTDLNGQTYWNNWTPADIGLTTGSWQITAVATINGQTKTATDPTDLIVP